MRVAVIDVGSNSIKFLVADRGTGGHLHEIASRTLEVRISAGIGSDKPRLSPEGIQRGIAAIVELSEEAKGLGAGKITAVATSAVRDASNGADFVDRAKVATGLNLRILTGDEEADFIGRGLKTDPALKGVGDFYVFDLGGGSLECLRFKDGEMRSEVSLPLGCVRLTEKFVASPSAPLGPAGARTISDYVKSTLVGSGFPLPVPPETRVVGTGGTMTAARAIAAARRNLPLEQADPILGIRFLGELMADLVSLDLEARKKIRGLPAARADVFPAALATLLALAEVGRIEAFQHSLRNLRWGIASELLSGSTAPL